ncbi:hypothetical protein L596_005226 [Steinernema carpocapsae]|uniref:Uncharacterized protein n=1 Tax=Steinernema carpocapsae TaxID=34508 RepID=A0A4U8UZW9_STECR|nr:hypothetical protein L596_005226 [Steinernema carpocapsae]
MSTDYRYPLIFTFRDLMYVSLRIFMNLILYPVSSSLVCWLRTQLSASASVPRRDRTPCPSSAPCIEPPSCSLY